MKLTKKVVLKFGVVTLITLCYVVFMGHSHLAQHERVHQLIFALDGCDTEVVYHVGKLAAETVPEIGCNISVDGARLHVLNEMVAYNLTSIFLVILTIAGLMIIKVFTE